MNRARGLVPWVAGTLVLWTGLARAQSDRESALLRQMIELSNNPPAACEPLNTRYFEAVAFAEAAEDKGTHVSAIFDAYLGDLARVRSGKGCAVGPRPRRSPTDKAQIVRTHQRLVLQLKTCKGDACKQLEEALKTNFFTIASVLHRDDPEVPGIIRDVTVYVPGDKLVEELVRKIRSGELSAKDLSELAKVLLAGVDPKQTASLLPEIVTFLKKVGDTPSVSDATLKDLFSAVFKLAANRHLSRERLLPLIDELRAIVSDDDLIRFAEVLKLRQSVRTPKDWGTLRSSVELLVGMDEKLKGLLPPVPDELPDAAKREQILTSLVNLLSEAQLIELNHLRAAAAAVSTEPQRIRRLRLLAVRRLDPACGATPAPPGCAVAKAMIVRFLATLGANPDGAAEVEVSGGADEILTKSETALKWNENERQHCDPARYGALCEWPYGGVVVIASDVAGSEATARASWRIRNDPSGLIGGTEATEPIKDVAQANQAGLVLGIETLRQGSLWKLVAKESPAQPCIDVRPRVVVTPPTWRRWTRVGLVLASAASILGAAYVHNTSPASPNDDRLLQVGIGSLAVLAGLEAWDLWPAATRSERAP